MAKAKLLQKFEGEFNGVYQVFWVVVSENNNIFRTSCLEYTDEGKPDIRNTNWTHISNATHLQITEEMWLKKTISLEVERKQEQHLQREDRRDYPDGFNPGLYEM